VLKLQDFNWVHVLAVKAYGSISSKYCGLCVRCYEKEG